MVCLGDAQSIGTDEESGLYNQTTLARGSSMVQKPDQQWDIGGDQQPDSGGQGAGPGIPHHTKPHHDDLSHWREAQFQLTHLI